MRIEKSEREGSGITAVRMDWRSRRKSGAKEQRVMIDGGCNDDRSLRFVFDVSRDIHSNTNTIIR